MAELEAAIANYRWAMEQLATELNPTTILRLFSARDQIHELLQGTPKMLVPNQIELIELDYRLRDYAWGIVQALELDKVRRSFNPRKDAWWWFLDDNLPPHAWDRFDWLWQTLTVSGWTINLALLGDIISRFFTGGIGVGGATAVILPTILTGLKARSDLKEKGQDVIQFIFDKFKIKTHFREEAKLITTAILLIIFGALWFSLPLISRVYNYLGYRCLTSGEVKQAEHNFERAIALDSNNTLAHYNLANLSEDLQDIETAITHYEIAVEQDFPAANNNLARIYLLADRESEAAVLLREGLAELPDMDTDENTDDLRYNMLKNLGWAKHRQGSTTEANKYLAAAEATAKNSNTAVTNLGSTYCLQALSLEDAGKPEAALDRWAKCCATGNPDNSDEDLWLVKGAKALEAAGQTCQSDDPDFSPYDENYQSSRVNAE